MLALSESLQRSYNEQYHENMTEWRELGAKYKAQNIKTVCGAKVFSEVLECGAGEGSILKWLDGAGWFKQLYAIEISDSGITRIKARQLARLVEVKKFDGYQIPYSDLRFEMAYCSHVLEHVEHPRLLLRELARVSRFQVFEVPLDYAPGIDKRAQSLFDYGHIGVFTPSTFKFLLKSEGYEILAEQHTYTAPEVTRYNWVHNLRRRVSLLRTLAWRTQPLRRAVRRLFTRADHFHELGFQAYTCLARRCGPVSTFGTKQESRSQGVRPASCKELIALAAQECEDEARGKPLA